MVVVEVEEAVEEKSNGDLVERDPQEEAKAQSPQRQRSTLGALASSCGCRNEARCGNGSNGLDSTARARNAQLHQTPSRKPSTLNPQPSTAPVSVEGEGKCNASRASKCGWQVLLGKLDCQ